MSLTNNLEIEKVHNVYDIISKHFSTTRKIIWPKVEDFINTFKSNSLVLDIGCGNGKNMGSRKDCIYIGLDTCENLMKQAKSYQNCSYIVGNCINLPFESDSFNYAMSIAVIHHLSTIERRLQAIQEINRILKIGGEALIYVWAYEQPRFENEKSQDVNVKWMLQKKYSEKKETDEIFYRYYHLFKKNELETLISNINTLEIIESGNQYNNWYCVVKKIE
tara:strand:- start:57 stop:716 length:660 start_codon:yes stop_codon:yes gene_type:complete